MKILLLSEACFTDSTFPLYKAMREKGLDATCLINLSSLHTGMIDINQRIDKQAIIPASQYAELRLFENYMDISNVYVVNHNLSRKYPWRFITCVFDIYRFIKRGRYDVIHTDVLFQDTFKLLYHFRKRIVYVRHDPLPHSGMGFSKKLNNDFAIAYNKISKIVILNSFQLDEFCRFYGIDRNKVYVNELGPLDCIRIFAPITVRPKKGNIIFFGRIVEYKGLEYLCKAMPLVHKVIPTASLTIAGSGNFYFNIEPYMNKPYIRIINRFIREDELALLISSAEFSVYPYTDATQSGALLTSYTFNKPVIATDIPGLREMVANGKNGYLVPPKDEVALSEAIIDLLMNDDKLAHMSNYIEEEYKDGKRSWSQIVDKYISIYRV